MSKRHGHRGSLPGSYRRSGRGVPISSGPRPYWEDLGYQIRQQETEFRRFLRDEFGVVDDESIKLLTVVGNIV